MNEIFLDTETTGLSFKDGHRVVEIACIETKDLIATGNVFHRLINPERNIPEEALKIHGFSEKFLYALNISVNISSDVRDFVSKTSFTTIGSSEEFSDTTPSVGPHEITKRKKRSFLATDKSSYYKVHVQNKCNE